MRSARLLFLCALAGCSSSTTRPPPPPPPPPPPHLVLTVALTRADGSFVSLDDRLRTGELLTLGLDINRAAHVYVGGISASGDDHLLVPERGQDAAADRASSWRHTLKLAPPAGPEVLFVIASEQPPSDVDQSLAVALGELPAPPVAPTPIDAGVVDAGAAAVIDAGTGRSAARPPRPRPPKPRDDPGFAPDTSRIAALHGKGQLTGRPIQILRPVTVVADERGIAVYLVRFTHDPAGSPP